ncbi:MAG: polyprenol monophosphomannose synthase [Bryobacteraceae bacterium]
MMIIPTYNERPNIATLVSRIRQAAPSEPIFFVDDGSPDGTAGVIRDLQRNDPNILLLERSGKGGYGSACREAMSKILREGLAEYVIQFDADLSHPPEALPRMIEMLRSFPVVIGSRYVAGGGTKNWDFRSRLLSRGGNFYARTLTGIPARDCTAGFVGYQVEALRQIDLSSIRSEGYAFLMEMKYALHRKGMRFGEFPIIFAEREGGKSKFSSRIMMEGLACPARILKSRLTGG